MTQKEDEKSIQVMYETPPETTEGATRLNRAFDLLFEETLKHEKNQNDNNNENETKTNKRV